MISLAPWYYRNLLSKNEIFEKFEFYKVQHIDGTRYFESNAFLSQSLKPCWLTVSKIYSNCDGTGTDSNKNIAVYKAISEALERYAFYSLAESSDEKYSFKFNPTTTGMASFPHFSPSYARNNARLEAIERWAIHQFNKNILPVTQHTSTIPNLNIFEILIPFTKVKICLLSLNADGFYSYSFGPGQTFDEAYRRAMFELNRNRTVLLKVKNKGLTEFHDTVDKTLMFYSTEDGYRTFLEKVAKAPDKILNSNPRVLCDLELKGPWSEYTKVWRFLLEDSYFDCSSDPTFFMF